MSNLDALQSRLDQAIATVQPKAKRFNFLTADQLLMLPPLEWRVHGVLPTTGLATIFGPSGSGKSFLLLDLMAAIAEGREWYARKTAPCRILCLVLEGKAGFLQRIRAWEKHNGRPYPGKVSFMMEDFGLNARDDVNDLEAAIRAVGGFDLILIDTLNRAAPNADENSSAAMSQLVSATGKLQAAISGLVILVHHTGKDESRGLRGHSSLFAAMDAALEVKRDGEVRRWRLLKSKDGKDGAEHPFKLTEVDLGEGDQGPESSCVIERTAAGSSAFDDGEDDKPKTPNQIAVMGRVNIMLATTTEKGQGGAEPDTPCVKVIDVLDQVKDDVTGGPRHHSQRAKEALDWLVEKQLVNRGGDWLWKTALPPDSP